MASRRVSSVICDISRYVRGTAAGDDGRFCLVVVVFGLRLRLLRNLEPSGGVTKRKLGADEIDKIARIVGQKQSDRLQ